MWWNIFIVLEEFLKGKIDISNVKTFKYVQAVMQLDFLGPTDPRLWKSAPFSGKSESQLKIMQNIFDISQKCFFMIRKQKQNKAIKWWFQNKGTRKRKIICQNMFT